jgi:hypothetical protein
VVFAAWIIFVIAGASFAKFSEHFDEALPHTMGAHRVADLAFTVLQTVAGMASALVVAGALLAVPAFVRFLRAGGWASVRGHFLRALACTVFTVSATVPLLVVAHHLTPHQRNGGLHWYGALFFLWVALIVFNLILWTVVVVATARRVVFSPAILAAEAILAAGIAVAMAAMVAATAVWWGAMAKYSPAFLNASPFGSPGSRWDILLVATVGLMVAAVGTAAAGVVREVSVWSKVRAG